MDIADFAHGIFRGFAEGEISDYDSVEILDQKVIQNGTIGQIFIQRKTLLWSTFKKIFLYGKKGYLCEKNGVLFLLPGYRYADKGEGGKKS